MQDTDWITVVSELEQQLLTAIYTVKELRADMEYRRSTRPAPEQLVMTSEPAVEAAKPVRRMAEVPRRNHHWTDSENERLVYLWLRNAPVGVIATELGRSSRSVETHIGDLRRDGVPLPTRRAIRRNP